VCLTEIEYNSDYRFYYTYFNADRVRVRLFVGGSRVYHGPVITCSVLFPQNQEDVMYVDPKEGMTSFMVDVQS
jgi:hypothetical protein